MKIVPPKVIADAVLLASNIPEADYPVWSAATAYNPGDCCIVAAGVHRAYRCLTAHTNKFPPDNSAVTLPTWEVLGATNRWKMFDAYVNTQSVRADSITVTIDVARCDSVVLLGVDAGTVALSQVAGGVTVYSETISMAKNNSMSWSDYFFGEFIEATELSRRIPLYGVNSQLTITLTRIGGTARLGHLVVGRAIYLGDTVINPKAGINDYSTKQTNDQGETSLEQGAYSKRLAGEVKVANNRVDHIFNRLAGVRASPAVWDFNNEGTDYGALIVYGFFKEFELVIPGPVKSSYSLEIEGLI
jgi:hypothetical protein